MTTNRKCRHCGCTDLTACLHDDGMPCAWVDDDLCTLCQEKQERARSNLMAAASNFAMCSADIIEYLRSGDVILSDMLTDGDTMTLALDAVRLTMEATEDPRGDLHPAICKQLGATP